MNTVDDLVFRVKGNRVGVSAPEVKALPEEERRKAYMRLKALGSTVAGFTGAPAKMPPTVAAMGGAGAAPRPRSPSPKKTVATGEAAKPKKAAAASIPKIPADTELIKERGRYHLGDMMYSSPVELRYAIYRLLFVGSWITHNYATHPLDPPIYGYPTKQFEPFFKSKFGTDYYGGAIGKFIHDVERWINNNSETSPHGHKYIRGSVYDRLRVANGDVPIERQSAMRDRDDY